MNVYSCSCCRELWHTQKLTKLPVGSHNLYLCPDCYKDFEKEYKPMQIKDAYIVYIDFDGDVKNKYSWGSMMVFTLLEEVKEVAKEALTDLLNHQKERNRDTFICVDDEFFGMDDVKIEDVLADDALLEKFIKGGGCQMGNWEIRINETN